MTVKIGMSAPSSEWSARLKEVGGVDARRLFSVLTSPSSALSLAKSEIAAHRMPVLSFKVPNNDWTGVANGKYDTQLKSLAKSLAGLNAPVFATLHHEPSGDGTPADWSKMLIHALPLLKAGHANVLVGPIANGFWWSPSKVGLSDAEIAQWIPPALIKVSDVIGADTYQGGTTAKPGEGAGPKIVGLSKWRSRVGAKALGLGEFNGLDAASITAAGKAILADKTHFAFANVFNSDVNNRPGVSWLLTGDRITAFKALVAAARKG